MRTNFFICVLIVLFAGISTTSCKKEEKKITQTEVTFKKEGELSVFDIENDSLKTTLDVEIADTDYEIQTGLMYRNSMKINRGMLFIFENEEERFFYMKNTRIPLDIIYINSNKAVISIQKNAIPFDETSLPSNGPAQYVLEVNASVVDDLNIKIGDSIAWN